MLLVPKQEDTMRNLILATVAVAAMAGQAVAAEWKKLMEPADLASVVGDVVVVDIRGQKEFARGSIKGAVNAPYGTWRGPADNPGQVLTDAGFVVTVRSTRGDDIDAACGQLVGQVEDRTKRSERHRASYTDSVPVKIVQ